MCVWFVKWFPVSLARSMIGWGCGLGWGLSMQEGRCPIWGRGRYPHPVIRTAPGAIRSPGKWMCLLPEKQQPPAFPPHSCLFWSEGRGCPFPSFGALLVCPVPSLRHFALAGRGHVTAPSLRVLWDMGLGCPMGTAVGMCPLRSSGSPLS